MIPVEVTQAAWHFTTFWDWLDHWQTIIAGGLALAAGLITVWVVNKQTKTTVRLERDRIASEARAFRAMLAAAIARVLAEVAWARKHYPELTKQATGGPTRHAYVIRTCITKGGFTELRAACVRVGSPLTGEFLDLEREIDSFASQWEEIGPLQGEPPGTKAGKHEGLVEQPASIEDKAIELRQKAVKHV